ncbi:carbon-nitrogen hydrolase family protein [Kineosporia sp. J2-2]|uniref:Carbon-nitrogen hydrolase family protein n=1 Tax=Kineosporia corallincola TaxID=2835133 RepID=A0ABS5TKN3_9ACTN|nr:carbon-nitrogen hydrolase family protein [Kineosporia corallincola]MBT0771652.1 carbon-nitrogen hydrolase family protein [Kineosporia corallincola]
MLIALAQIPGVPLDIEANVGAHVQAVEAAAAAGARLVLFPELSLTGYEIDGIASDPTRQLDDPATVDDERLRPLREACTLAGLTAVVGAPTRRAGRTYLSALALDGRGGVTVYDKRNLFGAEKDVFTAGTGGRTLTVCDRRLALGICFDLSDDDQAGAAAAGDAWMLGVLLTGPGYAADAARAAQVAQRHGVTVVLANHAGPSGGMVGCGGSGMWTADGGHVAADAGDQEQVAGVWLFDLDDAAVHRRIA